MTMTLTHALTAFNTATESENKIHDDAVASRFGFTGGLVPGVDDFAYMTHVPLSAWGKAWLSEGGMQARFLKPVYDGDAVTVQGEAEGADRLTLGLTARGIVCATGEAMRRVEGPAPALIPFAEPVETATRPKASMETLAVGTVLGSQAELYTAELGAAHLEAVRGDHALYEKGAICNPGYLLRRANYILALHVRLGPWIHTESRIRLHGLLHDGETFETRAVVAENVEKGGHLIVTLDFTQSAGERLVMSGRHWAIYEPRQVRTAA